MERVTEDVVREKSEVGAEGREEWSASQGESDSHWTRHTTSILLFITMPHSIHYDLSGAGGPTPDTGPGVTGALDVGPESSATA